MKKIIIAALSVLIGSFGYTIVDTALETRVAVLESEMQVVREEVSRYHLARPTHATQPTKPDTHNTTIRIEIPSYIPQTDSNVASMGTTKPNSTKPDNSIYVGKQLSKDTNSRSKFLIYVDPEGSARYISPDSYDNYLSSTATTERQSYAPNNTTIPNYTQELNTQISDIPVGEYWLSISESSAVISDIKEKNFYDKDYSLVSSGASDVYITFNCTGYIDPAFSDSEIVFRPSFKSVYATLYAEHSKVKPDGSFEYTAIYSYHAGMNLNNNLSYTIDSVSISPR